jgi:zinc/manganese transport system substrate-binding protein
VTFHLKLSSWFPIFAAMTLLFESASAGAAPLKVVATTATFADIVRRVGGEAVEVKAVAPPKFNVHFIQPKPSDVREVARADLFVHAGLDLEAWADSLVEAAGKPGLFRGGAQNLDMSIGVRLLKVPSIEPSRAHGDMHLFGNPHHQMNPENARLYAAAIAAKLSEMDPAGAAGYEERRAGFERQLDAKLAEWKTLCAGCAGKEIFSFHDDIAYLADFLGLKAERFFEPMPGVPPTPRHLAELGDYAAKNGVRALVMATYYDRAAAEGFAARSGLKVVPIGQNAGEKPGTADFFSFHEANIRAIADALA